MCYPIESLPQPTLCQHVRIRELGAEENNWLKVVQRTGSQAEVGLGLILPVSVLPLSSVHCLHSTGDQCFNYKAQQSLSNKLIARFFLP